MSTPAGKFEPGALAWGVEPVAGERNVLLVRSKSQPSVKHRVELEAYAGFGSCTCEFFRQFGKASKAEAALLAGRFPDEQSLCEHLRRARTWYYYAGVQRDIASAKAVAEHRRDVPAVLLKTAEEVNESYGI